MRDYLKFFIDGAWVDPIDPRVLDVVNPATEAPVGRISLASAVDVDRAVVAARRAFKTFSRSSRDERISLLDRVVAEFERRASDLAEAMTEEMGAPAWLARQAQFGAGLAHLKIAREILQRYSFEEPLDATTRLLKEPIGVCGLITPWNWPLNQICCKLAPALATGCAVVLKPSELAPFSAYLVAEILQAAGAPAGVFNMVNGDGPVAGAALSGHPLVDMVSFTGSTRAGVEVARNAAPTVKRVCQELGGKSPFILLEDADFAEAVPWAVAAIMRNSGQSCNAPTRLLAPASRMEEVVRLARAAGEAQAPGDPNSNAKLGPVVSDAQWRKVQALIHKGVEEGATLVLGGPGKPEGLERGYYVRPTIFADVTNDMTIAREEIFGPVLAILSYETESQAIEIANDTVYGLAAYVYGELAHARAVAAELRAGQVVLNGVPFDFAAPFGGYKQSGNGREWGALAFNEFLEVKAVMGWSP
ncbi:aldehyde dehydrogenase family protein [Methylocapsa acidiphila]|uniref:aldehyde dehydrogenase family protein n=1 Tax=Methylocapsa acidiphila TaxID=133552 RepID=UPI0003F6B1E0|nr:aldehyde dehydrogenase family protein [Methylocapsa acidiphila]